MMVKRIVLFVVDSVACYLFALCFVVPFFNVLLLRSIMGDSKSFRKVMVKCQRR